MSSEQRERWALIGAAVLTTALAFWAGRYSNPTRVEERVRVQVVEKQVVAIQERVRVEKVEVLKTINQVKVVEREVTRLDGTKERTRTEESVAQSLTETKASQATDTHATVHSQRQSASQLSKTASYALPRWRIGVTAGVAPFEAWRPLYGGEAGLRVAGPFWLGLAARSDGTVSASLAIEF